MALVRDGHHARIHAALIGTFGAESVCQKIDADENAIFPLVLVLSRLVAFLDGKPTHGKRPCLYDWGCPARNGSGGDSSNPAAALAGAGHDALIARRPSS